MSPFVKDLVAQMKTINVLGEDDCLPRKRQTFFIFTFRMVISYTAILYRGLSLSLLLVCITVFSAYAGPARWIAPASLQDSSRRSGFQDNKQDKEKKTVDPETKQPGAQRVDPGKRDPQKPEIKAVPKARKQLKPAAVKPKVKPVKIIRPKIKKH